MVSSYQQGQVWNAYIPYIDGPFSATVPTGKIRPVVIIGWSDSSNNGEENVLVVPISSFSGKPQPFKEGQFKVSDLGQAGLTKESFVQARRIMAISFKSIRQYKGKLTDSEMALIIKELGMMVRNPQENYQPLDLK